MKNIKKLLSLFMVLLLSFALVACNTTENTSEVVEISVSAAASLTEAVGEMAKELEKEGNIKLVNNFGSSGALQKQIEEGAPADVFLSAGQKQMNALSEKGLIDEETRFDFLKNRLVLIVPEDNKEGVNSIKDVIDKNVQIALPEVETSPAGQYSKEVLEKLELWDKIPTENTIQGKSVSEVLNYVDSGNVSAGMVFSSDVVRAKFSKQVEIFDEDLHKPIVYPAAILKDSKQKQAAQTFLEYLKSEKGKAILEKYGFSSL